MKIIEQSFEIITPFNREDILKHLEVCGRTCYKSEAKITNDSARLFVKNIAKNKHESVLEHVIVGIRMITDRGVTHELVRHRIASYSQESTRYVNYNGGEMQFIEPIGISVNTREFWLAGCRFSETIYNMLKEEGAPNNIARTVLNNSLKTEIVVTMNLRSWKHFFGLRSHKTAHPQIRDMSQKIEAEFRTILPEIYGEL